jgi:hypothetical protein
MQFLLITDDFLATAGLDLILAALLAGADCGHLATIPGGAALW